MRSNQNKTKLRDKNKTWGKFTGPNWVKNQVKGLKWYLSLYLFSKKINKILSLFF